MVVVDAVLEASGVVPFVETVAEPETADVSPRVVFVVVLLPESVPLSDAVTEAEVVVLGWFASVSGRLST